MKTEICKTCGNIKNIDAFYVRKNGRRRLSCKLCMAKTDKRELHSGSQIERKELAKVGLRKCKSCNKKLSINKFAKQIKYRVHNGNCIKCNTNIKLNNERYNSYYTSLASKRFNIPYQNIDQEIVSLIKLELEIKSKLFIYFNNEIFKNETSFANYLLKQYNISTVTTLARLAKGYSLSECLIPSWFFRKLTSGMSHGIIKVTHINTDKVFFYMNKSDCMKYEHIGLPKIKKGLLTGLIPKNNLKLEYYER